MKTYKIRKFQNGKNSKGKPFINYSLTIPSAVAEALPDDVQFACELTEDGILFRPSAVESENVTLPTWAKGRAPRSSNGNAGTKASAPAKASSARARPARAGRRARPGSKKKS